MQLQQELFDDNIAQYKCFPSTRYMGSKQKIVLDIWKQISKHQFNSVYDAFAGSNVVAYFLKSQGKKIVTNDFLSFSYIISKAIIENSSEQLLQKDINFIFKKNKNSGFIQKTFKDLFFTDQENEFLDRVRKNISLLDNEYKSALALSALVRACLKKRARGIFTFVGSRYDDGRADMKKNLEQHFLENITYFNNAVFDNKQKNKAYNKRTEKIKVSADLVYLDPPYFTPKSDNDYLRRYHFVEGLVRNWEGVTIQKHTLVKKFESYKTPFSKKETAYSAFENLFKKFQNSIIVISYSSNGFPNKNELSDILRKYKSNVTVEEIDHTYSFGNQNHKIGNINNRVKEYIFIGV